MRRPFISKPTDFNSYSAGNKVYGAGRSNPTMGPVDKTGFKERDLIAKSRRNAVLKRLQARQKKNYMSSASLGGPR